MITKNGLLVEQLKPIPTLVNTVPSSSTPTRVSLKNYSKVTFLILVKNAATVTGSAITLKQSQDVSGTGEKAVSFARAFRNLDVAAGEDLAASAVTGDTFTTDATNSKNLLYAVEVRADDLDADGGFDCVRVGTGDATAATVTVLALLWPAKFAGPLPLPPALTN